MLSGFELYPRWVPLAFNYLQVKLEKRFPLSLFLIDLSTFRICFSYYFVFSAAFYNCCSLTICAISFTITKIRLARFDTIEKKNNIYSRTISFSWNETIRCLIGKGWESLIYGKTDIIIIIPAGHRWTTYIHNLIKSPFLDLSSLRNQTETLATQGPQGTAPTDHDSYKLRWVGFLACAAECGGGRTLIFARKDVTETGKRSWEVSGTQGN